VFTSSGTYPWSLMTLIFRNGLPSHGGDFRQVKMNNYVYHM